MKKQNIQAILLSILIIGISLFIFNHSVSYQPVTSKEHIQKSEFESSNRIDTQINKQEDGDSKLKSRIYITYADKENIGVYISPSLGITFEFVYEDDIDSVKITESSNSIIVNDSTKITVFKKYANLSLLEAIQKYILVGYDPEKCWVEYNIMEGFWSLTGYHTANIAYPGPEDVKDPWWENAKNCPFGLTAVNGVSEFVYDKNKPDKFAFVDRGQAVAARAPSEFGNKDFTYTLKFMTPQEQRINSLIEYGIVEKYFLSPSTKHAFVSVFNKSPSYYLFNLETGKSIFPDSEYNGYYFYNSSGLNEKNLIWHDDYLFIASEFSSHGAEGFPGIVKVDLKSDTAERLIDFTDKCPFDDTDYPFCPESYFFEIKSIKNNTLTYQEIFNNVNEGISKYNYSVEKTLVF